MKSNSILSETPPDSGPGDSLSEQQWMDLHRLSREDPAAFAAERRRLIQELLDSRTDGREAMQKYQENIDHLRAIAGAPHPAMRAMFVDLAEQVTQLAAAISDYRTAIETHLHKEK